ncbi:hypothetical protein GCM10027160_30950 [Streptomyces calidiresistens]
MHAEVMEEEWLLSEEQVQEVTLLTDELYTWRPGSPSPSSGFLLGEAARGGRPTRRGCRLGCCAPEVARVVTPTASVRVISQPAEGIWPRDMNLHDPLKP